MQPRLTRIVLLVVIAVGLNTGCGSTQQMAPAVDPDDPTANWPDWYQNPPQEVGMMRATATMVSRDPQNAISEAKLEAENQLGTQVEAQIQSLMTRFVEEVGSGDDAQFMDKTTAATRRSVDQSMSGARIVNQKTIADGKSWRAFVLVEMPQHVAETAIMGGITRDEEMYTRFRASQAFKDLEATLGN